MTSRPPFATRADIQARHPNELAILAMDESTRQVDLGRVDAACEDASDEIRSVLGSRYTAEELDRVDDASGRVLRLFAMDIALYRLAMPPRQTEALQARYSTAIARLKDMARGTGALTIVSTGAAGGAGSQPGVPSTGSPNEVLMSANERLFTRHRFGGA
jgi:phage gp36-like protein